MKLKDVDGMAIAVGVACVIAIGAMLAGVHPDIKREPHRCERQALFDSCLARVPKGPNSTVYNDWSEVVNDCDHIAKSQASYITVRENRNLICEVKK